MKIGNSDQDVLDKRKWDEENMDRKSDNGESQRGRLTEHHEKERKSIN